MSEELVLRPMTEADGRALEKDRCTHKGRRFFHPDCNCIYCERCEQRLFACGKHRAAQKDDARDVKMYNALRTESEASARLSMEEDA